MTSSRRRLPRRHWAWAWRLFTDWSRVELDDQSLTSSDRRSVVARVVPAVVRNRYLEPARLRLLACAPAWVVAMRLQRRTQNWYLVPTRAAAEHVRLRFDFWPIGVGDHVRIERGRLTAIGCAGQNFSEIIFVQPNVEPEPDPYSPEMSKAWAAYWQSKAR